MTPHPTQLFSLLYSTGRIEKLQQALDQTKARMEKAGENEIWSYWQGTSLAALGKFDEASQIAETLSGDAAFNLKRIIMVERGKQKGEWKPVAQFLEERWLATKSPSDLLPLCEAKINAAEPQFVADHARELLQAFNTQEVLRLSLMGAARSKSWRLCLDLLSDYANLFPSGKLPPDLRRIRIIAEQNLGLLTAALQDAQELVRDGSDIEDIARLFELRIHSGNLKEAIGPATTLLNSPKISADFLVRIGWIMRLEDKALSSEALRRAVGKGISSEAIGPATLLAHELAMPELSALLIPKMAEEAKKPNASVQSVDIQQIREWKTTSDKQAMEVFSQLKSGLIPIHVVEVGIPEAITLWPILALSDVSRGFNRFVPPIFFRHGGRTAIPPQRSIQRLHVDITAFITAHELGILPLVEKVFGPLFIPPSLRSALLANLDRLGHAQSDFDEAKKSVLTFCDKNQIRILPANLDEVKIERSDENLPREWWDSVQEAKQTGGLIVEPWPKLKADLTAYVPTPEVAALLTSPIALVTALRRLGAITGQQFESVERESTQASGSMSALKEPQKGSTLVTSVTLAETFARWGILQPLLGQFKVAIPSQDVQILRNEINALQGRAYAHSRVHEMLQHLRMETSYREIVLEHSLASDANVVSGPVMATVEELMQVKPLPGYLIWVDDRWANSHERYGEVQMISTLGIIEELKRTNNLGENAYYACRNRLRIADFRFIPLIAQELLFLIKGADVSQDVLTVTPELLALQQYFARILLDRDAFQFPPLQANAPRPQGEIEFLNSSITAVVEAITSIFQSDSTNDVKNLQAGWLFDNLWCNLEQMPIIFGRENPKEAAKFAEGSGDMLFLARLIDQKAFKSEDNFRQCVAWLDHKIFSDLSRRSSVAEHVSRILDQEASRATQKPADKARLLVLSRWHANLPSSIQDQVKVSERTRLKLGIRNTSVIQVNNIEFLSKPFWQAAEKAYNGKEAILDPITPQNEIKVEVQHSSPVPALVFRTEGKAPWGFEDDILALLDRKIGKRIEVLQRHPEWLDSAGGKISVMQVANLRDGAMRVSKINDRRNKSIWHRYMKLAQIYASKVEIPLDDLSPPNVDEFAHYLRWPSNAVTDNLDWEAIGKRLLIGVGWEQAFSRLAGLPKPLPNILTSTFKGFRDEDKQAIFKKLSNSVSPMARCHVLELKKCSGLDCGPNEVNDLMSDAVLEDGKALLQIVHWAWGCFGELNFSIEHKDVARLAFSWVHANQLFSILKTGSTSSEIFNFFSKNDRTPVSEMFVSSKGEDDICYPRNLSSEVLVMTAIASALSAGLTEGPKVADSIMERAKAIIISNQGELNWPRVEWLYSPSLFSNRLESFLGSPRDKLLSALIGEESARILGSESMLQQMEALLAGLELDSTKAENWAMFGFVLRGRPCPDSLKSRLAAVMKRTNFSKLNFGDSVEYSLLLTVCTQAWHAGGEEFILKYKNEILSFAKKFGNQAGITETQKQESIYRCVASLTRHAEFERQAALCADTLIDLSTQLQDFRILVRSLIPIILRLPFDQLRAFWKLILITRVQGS